MNLCVRYADVTLAIELKVCRHNGPDSLSEELSQIDGYLRELGLDTGWLVIFDRHWDGYYTFGQGHQCHSGIYGDGK